MEDVLSGVSVALAREVGGRTIAAGIFVVGLISIGYYVLYLRFFNNLPPTQPAHPPPFLGQGDGSHGNIR